MDRAIKWHADDKDSPGETQSGPSKKIRANTKKKDSTAAKETQEIKKAAEDMDKLELSC